MNNTIKQLSLITDTMNNPKASIVHNKIVLFREMKNLNMYSNELKNTFYYNNHDADAFFSVIDNLNEIFETIQEKESPVEIYNMLHFPLNMLSNLWTTIGQHLNRIRFEIDYRTDNLIDLCENYFQQTKLISEITKNVQFKDRVHTILYYNVYNGHGVKALYDYFKSKHITMNSYIYHNTTHSGRLDTEYLDHDFTIAETYDTSLRMSNRVFDIGIYFPDTKTLFTDSQVSCASMQIARVIHGIQMNGLFIGILPIYKIYGEIRKNLLRHLKDIHICIIDKDHSLCVITGVKTTSSPIYDKDSVSRIDEATSKLSEYENTEYTTCALPDTFKNVEEFRGTKPSVSIIEKLQKDTTLCDKFIEKQYETHSISDRKPMLPFTSGQLGLVLVSGKLDGIINEDNGHAHIVKGMAVKQVIENKDAHTQTVTNKVVISIFKPDGNFKRLI